MNTPHLETCPPETPRNPYPCAWCGNSGAAPVAPAFPELLSQSAIDRQERNRRYRELIEDTLGCAALWIIAAIGFFFAGVL